MYISSFLPSNPLSDAGVWSRSLSFEGDSDSGPSLFHLNLGVIKFLCNLFDFCTIYFTTKTLLVYYCAPFIRRI